MGSPYTLWDRKADRVPVTNWSFCPIPEDALLKVGVGDVVRLMLLGASGESWEKPYYLVTKVDYYSKGSSGKQRKFRGKCLDTYKLSNMQYLSTTGEEINFQRRNIVEVPGWHEDSFGAPCGGPVRPQDNAAVELSRAQIDKAEREVEDAEFEREQAKKKKAR
mmetsp:Transcript_16316/g.55556  ORF Transcript_16316/g.55556 Transcript_16316/m.55556 type:complete len:163 (+) Transcript_16316:36-524(+)